MYWLDWIIVFIPLLIVLVIGLKSQKYVKSVADFLAAGRVAGRYVLGVSAGMAGMGLISLVGSWEVSYNTGFAVGFWNQITAPLGLLFGLFGYCGYRFRETKAMTLGQFFEIRYNRAFRIYAGVLQSISGVINYAIFPAVSARCIMYFLDLPIYFHFLGLRFSTFFLLMLLFLGIAVWIVTMGGQVTIMVTDCVQGLVSYPLYAIIVFYLIYRFSWKTEVVPALLDRPEGMSMLNPYDVSKLRDFNLFYVFVGIFSGVFNRMSWSGSQGYNGAARNAHESKMSGLLGTWRAGFSSMMYLLLAVAGFVCMKHINYKDVADKTHLLLAHRVSEELTIDKKFDEIRPAVQQAVDEGTVSAEMQQVLKEKGKEFDYSKPIEPAKRGEVARAIVGTVDMKTSSSMATLTTQMTVPVALRELLPIGITGGLCALMIFLMLSTDTTYLHSWGSILGQDIIVPLRKKPMTPKGQLLVLRLLILFVAVFALIFSYYFAQMDYVLMFFAITGAIWLGGAGAVIVFGLYWNKGTSWGAFTSLTAGSGLAVGGILCQQFWPQSIYPFLQTHEGWFNFINGIFEFVTRHCSPYIVWSMNPDRFPINSQEIFFLSMLISIFLYVVVSLCTCRKPFNMEKMLHRGAYAEGVAMKPLPWSWDTLFQKLIGIDANYTRGDKILAWSVFIWSFGVMFLGSFVLVVIWNLISPWSNEGWANYFLFFSVLLPGIVAIVSTVWFVYGGCRDMRQLFRDLAVKKDDDTDNGRVEHDKE